VGRNFGNLVAVSEINHQGIIDIRKSDGEKMSG
jgi:hypothetical protein